MDIQIEALNTDRLIEIDPRFLRGFDSAPTKEAPRGFFGTVLLPFREVRLIGVFGRSGSCRVHTRGAGRDMLSIYR